MFRIAKPEGFVLISPSREAVGVGILLHTKASSYETILHIGRQTERCGVSAPDTGTSVSFLRRPFSRPRFSVVVSIDNDRI